MKSKVDLRQLTSDSEEILAAQFLGSQRVFTGPETGFIVYNFEARTSFHGSIAPGARFSVRGTGWLPSQVTPSLLFLRKTEEPDQFVVTTTDGLFATDDFGRLYQGLLPFGERTLFLEDTYILTRTPYPSLESLERQYYSTEEVVNRNERLESGEFQPISEDKTSLTLKAVQKLIQNLVETL